MANVGNVGNEPKDLYVKEGGGDGQDKKTKAKTPSKEINSAFTVQKSEILEINESDIIDGNKASAKELLNKLYIVLGDNKPISQQNIDIISHSPKFEPAGTPFRGENAKIQPDNLNEQGIKDLISNFNSENDMIELVGYNPNSFKKEGDVISFTVSYNDVLGSTHEFTYKFDSVTGKKLPLDLPKDFGILRDNEGNITGYEVKGSFEAYNLKTSSLPEGSIEYTEIWDKDCQVTNRKIDFSDVKYEYVSMKGDIHKTGVIEYDLVKNQGVQPEENKPKKSLNMEW